MVAGVVTSRPAGGFWGGGGDNSRRRRGEAACIGGGVDEDDVPGAGHQAVDAPTKVVADHNTVITLII